MIDFHRTCQRIGRNDPGLTRVVLVPTSSSRSAAPPWKWDAERVAEFAAAMSTNTVLEYVEIGVGCGGTTGFHDGSIDYHGRTSGSASGIGSLPASASASRRSAAFLSSLSRSAQVGRALARVIDVRLIGDSGADDDHENTRRGPRDDGSASLLLPVLLNVLGTSARLRRLGLSNISFTRSASLGLQNLLSRTSTLTSIDLRWCVIVGRRKEDILLPVRSLAPQSVSSPPPSDILAFGQITTAEAIAAVVCQAIATNRTLERVSVDAAREGSCVLLDAVAAGSMQRQELQGNTHCHKPLAALRVFELRLPSWQDVNLPLSLVDFLAMTTAREIRVRGGCSRNLHLILGSCCWLNRSADPPRTLHLQGCRVSQTDIVALAKHISQDACSLSELSIHEMDLGLDGLRAITDALASHGATLRTLDLFDIRAGTPQSGDAVRVAMLVRDLLRSNHQLTVLKLGEMGLGGEEGSRYVAEGLSLNPTLQELALFHVPDVNLHALVRSCSNLQRLSLALCCFGIGPRRLAHLMKTLQIQARKLTDLDLSYNRFGNSEAVVLGVFVRQATSLRRLSLEQNNITDTGAISLFRSLENHPTMNEFGLSGNCLGASGISALLHSLPAFRIQYLALWLDDEETNTHFVDRLKAQLALNSCLISLDLESDLVRANRQCIEYYLYRNRLFPWLKDDAANSMFPSIPTSLWSRAMPWLSKHQTGATYFIMRQKLPMWQA
jgi:Ran GTPase-activating protein (RanGAP) involved in mRNA processing and transport